MVTILQTAFSNLFYNIEIVVFQVEFDWSLFPMVQLTMKQHQIRLWIPTKQETSHYLRQWWRVYWWIINGLTQDYSNSSTLTMEVLQSCTKPSICIIHVWSSHLDEFTQLVLSVAGQLASIFQWLTVRLWNHLNILHWAIHSAVS